MTYTLYLNTALEPYFFACYHNEVLVFEHSHCSLGLSLENLGVQIHNSLEAAGINSLDTVLTVQGPGKFTAIRLGIATAKAISAVMQAKLLGVNTLVAMVSSVSLLDQVVFVLCPLKPGYYYQALYGCNHGTIKALSEPLLLKKHAVETLLKKIGKDIVVLSTQALDISCLQRTVVWPISSKGLQKAHCLNVECVESESVQAMYVFEP